MTHENYLKQALQLAEIRRGFCAPNPSVGAVVVKNDIVLSTGFHFASGAPHAEVDALNKCGDEANGATIYVTLEPCCHTGKTPPCTQLLIDRGIKTVIYAYRDPNPIVAGKGHAALEAANISCEHYVLPEITAFYESYRYWQSTGLPKITAKIAISLDGKIAGPHGQRTQITGSELQLLTHQYRKRSDAIITTAKTILLDNPQLNVRLNQETHQKPLYILDSHLMTSPNAAIFKTAKNITLLHRKDALTEKIRFFTDLGVSCIAITHNEHGLVLAEVFQVIGKMGYHDVWIEAGGQCFSSLIREQLLHQALIYIGATTLGPHALSAFPFDQNIFANARDIAWQIVGPDIVCHITWR